MRFFPYVVLLSACALISTATLLAQSPNGVINGLVVDPSSRIVAGADVVVANDVTGLKYTTKTNDEGIYVLPNLPPGPYRLQVSKIGFKTTIKPDIVLNVQDALSINFTLPIGALYETVTVEGGALMINTTDASVSTVVDETYVKNMPLNGRSLQDLILLTAGTVTQTPQVSNVISSTVGVTGEFSVNGQRTESNYYTVDGVSANVGTASGLPSTLGGGLSGSLAASTALGTTQALVSVDDLQEFRVQSSTYSAEYGRNPGGQFAFDTKSGTNQWHGTAYDYLRNGALDAQDWFNSYFRLTEPELRQNDFGGTLGGPVQIPNLYHGNGKTFFFVSYEGLRLAAPQAAGVNYVPDTTLRSSVPTSLQQALNAFPLPNGPDVGNGIAEFIGSWSNPGSLDSTSVRFDHVINDKLRLFFRFSDTSSNAAARGTSATFTTPTSKQTSLSTVRTYTSGATSVFSTRLSNEFRLNYSMNDTSQRYVIDAFGGSTPLNLARILELGAQSSPEIFLLYGGYVIILPQQQSSGSQRQWNAVDTVTLSMRRHQFKFGVDYRRLAPFEIPASPVAIFQYLSESAVEANSASVNVQNFASGHPLYTNFSAFAQDNWRVSPRLSVALGLRWEVNPAPGVAKGLKPYTIQGSSASTWILAPQGTPLWQTTWYNFAPRLGVAYRLHDTPGRETVVRGGGGIFFDTGQQLGSLGFNGGPGFFATMTTSGSFPESIAVPALVNPPVPPYSSVVGYASHLQLPYTIQWNASVEQEMGTSQALSVSYVGSHATRLLQQNSLIPPGNATIGFLVLVENGLTSDYNSLQAQFRRRLSRRLGALASYTWSHCIDYGSQNYNIGYQRGNCDFDVRHNLSTAFSFDFPDAGRGRFSKAVLHNWGFDDRFIVRTAFPLTLIGNFLLQPNGQFYNAGLNVVSGQPIYLYGSNCTSVLQGLGDLAPRQTCPGGRAVNPNAFTPVDSGLGDAPRNAVRGFGAWQMNVAIRRDFTIHERLKLQFRAEAFNAFNHPNFGSINVSYGQSTFGQATATLANSLGVLNSLYQMGGPRSMQFALKLVF
jgi:hypothetical protein